MFLLVATFLVWASICLSHIRFRAALKAQSQSVADLPFKALWYPFGTCFALGASVFLVFFQGYTSFSKPFSKLNLVMNYILIPVFIAFVVVYKTWKRTKWVSIEDMDIWTGRREFSVGKDSEEIGKGIWNSIKSTVIG
jgi:amino acid transporter